MAASLDLPWCHTGPPTAQPWDMFTAIPLKCSSHAMAVDAIKTHGDAMSAHGIAMELP